MSVAQVQSAVQALYSGDPSQQAQANQWLTAFQASPEAWQVPFALLAAEQPQELQFFAVALLLRKVRGSEWGHLDAATKQGLGHTIRVRFQDALGWQTPSPLVLRHFCLLLAALAGAAAGDGASNLVTQGLAQVAGNGGTGGQPSLGLELLAAVAEEAEDLDRVRRLALVTVLLPRAAEVLRMLGGLLAAAAAQQQQVEGAQQAVAAALRCTEAWLRLTQVAGGGCMLPPGELRVQQPQLFEALLALVVGGSGSGSGSEAVVEGAVQVLLLVFGAENFSADESLDGAAATALMRVLLGLRGRLASAPSDTIPLAVAKLGSALVERAPEHCCSSELPEAEPFSELMLECLGWPELAAAENSLDYFLMANTVPLAERAPALGPPLYEKMVQQLVQHARLPPDFTSWEECIDLDEDAFQRLREHSLPEALDVAYGLLRLRYLSHAWQLLQGAGSWQDAEVALYLLSAVSLSVKTRVLAEPGRSGGSGGANGENAAAASDALAQDRQQSQQLLVALFGQLCSEEGSAGVLSTHPLLAHATCRLLERYSSWFGRVEGSPLERALQCLLRALTIPGPGTPAASAFQQLCLRCAWRLRDPAAVGALIDAGHAVLQQAAGRAGTLGAADQRCLVEGLARLVAGLQGDQLLGAAMRLTQPFIQQAAAAAAQQQQQQQQQQVGGGRPQAPPPQARQTAADSLRLLAAALRFLAPAGEDGADLAMAPAARVLQEAEPTLRMLAGSPSWQQDGEAMAALTEVYRHALGSARKQSVQLLPWALPALGAVFQATALPACLEVLGEALELHFQKPEVVEALLQALGAACAVAFPLLQGELRERQQLAAALLGLADQFAVYAPERLCGSALLGPLLQLAGAAVALREVEPVSAALTLLGHVASLQQRAADEDRLTQGHLDAAHAVLEAQGELLLRALLGALCDSCPRHLMRTAADCLRELVAHPALGPAARGWLSAALASGQLPGVAERRLGGEDCSTLAALALGGKLRGPRFNAMLVDFGQVARGENTSDVLLAYEL